MHIGTIHFYNRSFPPEIRLEKESRALIKEGHKITVLTQKMLASELEYEQYEKNFNIFRAQIRKPGLLSWIISKFTFFNKEYVSALRHFIEEYKPDVLHVHDFNQVPTALKIAKQYDIPVVADLHENMPAALLAFRSKYAPIKKILHSILYNYYVWRYQQARFLPQCAGILVVVPEAADVLISLGVPREKIIAICNTEDETTFKIKPEQSDQSIINKYKNYWTISYVGGLSAERGLDTVIKALPFARDNIPNLKLLVVGSQGKQSEEIYSWASRVSVDDIVDVVGWQPFSMVNSYVMASKICLVPHNEFEHTHTTVPHKLFQYMICAKPVLVSSCRPLRRIVEDAQSGVVFRANNAKDLADKLVYMYENPAALKEMGFNGKAAALDKYAWRNEAKKLVEFYAGLSKGSQEQEARN